MNLEETVRTDNRIAATAIDSGLVSPTQQVGEHQRADDRSV